MRNHTGKKLHERIVDETIDISTIPMNSIGAETSISDWKLTSVKYFV